MEGKEFSRAHSINLLLCVGLYMFGVWLYGPLVADVLFLQSVLLAGTSPTYVIDIFWCLTFSVSFQLAGEHNPNPLAHLSRIVKSNNNVATSLNLKGPRAAAVHLSSAISSIQQYIQKWQQLHLTLMCFLHIGDAWMWHSGVFTRAQVTCTKPYKISRNHLTLFSVWLWHAHSSEGREKKSIL